MDLKEFIKTTAAEIGFSAAGISSAEYNPAAHDRLLRWLDSGYQAGMSYMERATRKRFDPKIHLSDARSVIVCALNYYNPPEENPDRPYISIYARGEDYHNVARDKLTELRDRIANHTGDFNSKIMVDSSPISEKHFAVRAGLGFIGRNGTLIIPRPASGGPPKGSFHFLGLIVTDLDIAPDSPIEGTCGECRRCIEACPTDAIVADGVIESSKCISYHTTQSYSTDEEMIDIQNMLFGCDICQVVCPYNKKSVVSSEPRLSPKPELSRIDPEEFAGIDKVKFDILFENSAIGNIKFDTFKRNLESVSRYINNRS